MTRTRPTIEEQRGLVEQVEAYRVKREYLTLEQVCARLGIEWTAFQAARRAASLPPAPLDVAPSRRASDDPERQPGRTPRFTLADFAALIDRVDNYVANHGCSRWRALKKLHISQSSYSYAKRCLAGNGRKSP